jgi:effector-binding domain-containing protein
MVLAWQEAPMIDIPRIARTDEQLTAVIHLTVPRSEIRQVMGLGLAEVRAAVAAQGLTPTGSWFTHPLRMDPEVFDFEVGVTVPAEVVPSGRVRPGRLPEATVARTVYRGPYEGLGDGWGQFMAWIAAEGQTPGPDLWEVYAVGPESDPDPAGWRTELYRPLIGPA